MKKWGDLASAVLAVMVAIHMLFAIFGESGNEKHKALVHRVQTLEKQAAEFRHEMQELRKESTLQYKELTRLLMELNNKR